jgi:hypothetical protein
VFYTCADFASPGPAPPAATPAPTPAATTKKNSSALVRASALLFAALVALML